MVERHGVRYREPILAAIYGLTRNPKSYAAYAKMSQPAKKGVEEVRLFRGLI